MQFIDLGAQYEQISSEVRRRIDDVLSHRRFINGPETEELEERLANFVGTDHCVAVSSGTDALLIGMLALGIGRGDEVITTPFSFIATAEVIALIGAKPVFVDIEADTYNLDASKLECAITSKTKLVMPVSLYGQTCDMDKIMAIAGKRSIPVIEDAAQSFGATYRGRKSCALSEIGCTSFFPSKPLGCYGDGGACFTDNASIAKAMREIRVHGQERRYYHTRIGINGRLDTLQAAILLAKMDIFPAELEKRQIVATRYLDALGKRHDLPIQLPRISQGNTSVYAQYTIALDERDRVVEHLKKAGIPSAVHYPIPLSQQPILRNETDDLPIASKSAERVLSLPFHPYLEEKDQESICAALTAALEDSNALSG